MLENDYTVVIDHLEFVTKKLPFWRVLEQKKTPRKKNSRFDLPTEAKRPNINHFVIFDKT